MSQHLSRRFIRVFTPRALRVSYISWEGKEVLGMAQLTWIRERQGRSWRMPGGLMITGIDYAFLLEMLPGIINLSLYVLVRLRLNDYSCF